MSKIIKIDPRRPEQIIIEAAAEIIRTGGVVVIPTRHLYGLAADALNIEALKRVFAIKGRPADKPLLILVRAPEELPAQVRAIPDTARRLMHRFWPGRLTLVFEARNTFPTLLTGGSGKVGIRLPGHPVCQALLNKLANPITATSANFSGHPGCHSIADLPNDLQTAVDLVIDAGALPQGAGSTVVDVTMTPPRILRAGALGKRQIAAALAGK